MTKKKAPKKQRISRARTPPYPALPEWTTSKFWSFIRSGLRSKFGRWPAKYAVLAAAKRPVAKKGRQKFEYQCAICTDWHKQTNVEVDHQIAAGSLKCKEDLAGFVERLFCSIDDLQVVCKPCHKELTKRDRSIRKEYPREECVYRNMRSRCNNPNSTGYEYYGGRGIKVCASWEESFFNFYDDMGKRPDNTTLDRIDVDGGYSKENCRWATHKEQGNNTRGNTYLDVLGEILTVQQWGEKLKIKPNTISTRLSRGWSVEESLQLVPREAVLYCGRLTQEEITDMLEQIDAGMSQSEWGALSNIDHSQVSRLYRRFKTETAEERKKK